MKNILYSAIAIAAASLLAACSNISEDERFIYVKPAQVNRAVLIEDFTGQRCLNCPNATDVINSLQETYGEDAVIGVGIHSGNLGFKGSATVVGLATDLGDTYYNYYGATYQPVGMVNRHGLTDYIYWATYVSKALQETAPLELDLDCQYDESAGKVSISVEAMGTNGATSGKLQLWVLEDSITALQIMPDGSYNAGYVHNHVLRTAVNGTWGDDFSIAEGEVKTLPYTLTMESLWVPKNVSIVAFVYNSNGVQQVVKKHIMSSGTTE